MGPNDLDGSGERGRYSATLEAGVGWGPAEVPSAGRGGKLPPRATSESPDYSVQFSKIAKLSVISQVLIPPTTSGQLKATQIFPEATPWLVP